jgi:hypothetical protein
VEGSYGAVGSIYGIKKGSTLYSYTHKQISVKKGNRKYRGVRVHVLKGKEKKVLKGGFLGSGQKHQKRTALDKLFGRKKDPIRGPESKITLIYKRRPNGKLRVIYGPSLSGWFAYEPNLNSLTEFASTQMEKTLKALAEYRLKKLGDNI